MVRWYCQQQECFEDAVPVDGKDQPHLGHNNNEDLMWLNRPYPCLESYQSLVFSYSRKKLTFDQDSLPAFSGILKLLSQTFDGGFLFGLPELFFDIALAWRVKYRDAGRRSCSTGSNPLPSWSWTGWHGVINIQSGQDSEFAITESQGRGNICGHTIPITEWYTIESPNSHSRRRVKSDWFRYKLESQDVSVPLPLGWTRHSVPIGHNIERFCQRKVDVLYWYSHILIPNTKFYYPLPILDKSAEPVISPSTPFLFCKTSFGIFYADGLVQPNIWVDDAPCSLRDSSGKWVGILHPFSRQENARFLAHPYPGEKVTLVAISRGHFSIDRNNMLSDFVEAHFVESPRDMTNYEYYSVLWVEWVDGVAYRKGLGRVWREIWERLREDNDIDLFLG